MLSVSSSNTGSDESSQYTILFRTGGFEKGPSTRSLYIFSSAVISYISLYFKFSVNNISASVKVVFHCAENSASGLIVKASSRILSDTALSNTRSSFTVFSMPLFTVIYEASPYSLPPLSPNQVSRALSCSKNREKYFFFYTEPVA